MVLVLCMCFCSVCKNVLTLYPKKSLHIKWLKVRISSPWIVCKNVSNQDGLEYKLWVEYEWYLLLLLLLLLLFDIYVKKKKKKKVIK